MITIELEEIKNVTVTPYVDGEKFFRVPGLPQYAISDHSHLVVYRTSKEKWENAKLTFKTSLKITNSLVRKPVAPDYFIFAKFDYETKKRYISLTEIIRKTFYPGSVHIQYGGDVFTSYIKKKKDSIVIPTWDITKFYPCYSKKECVNYVLAKFAHKFKFNNNHIETLSDGVTPLHAELGLTNKILNQRYSDMKARATNAKLKKRKPRYQNTTICEEWLKNKISFEKWFNDNWYCYPGEIGYLELDKDLFSNDGSNKEYGPDNCCLLPHYINICFVESKLKYGYKICRDKQGDFFIPKTHYHERMKFKSYDEALTTGRKLKADYLKSIVENERERLFIPERILRRLEEVADLTEKGEYPMFEPSDEIKNQLLKKGT